jgi:hypothetical protein
MARKSAIVRNLNAAQHEFSAAAKPMRVKTVPDANFRCHLWLMWYRGIITRRRRTINKDQSDDDLCALRLL